MRSLNLFVLLVLAVSILTGCGGDGKSEFTGTASWNGTSIADGYVELMPVDGKGQVASAEIVDGAFTIRTSPGDKRVSVTAQRKIGERPPTERVPVAEPIFHQFIPEEFNSRTTFQVTVASGDPIEIDLSGTEVDPDQGPSPEEEARRRAQAGSEN